MRANHRQSLIERYAGGSMSADEQRAFQQKLRTDPKLRRLLAAEQTVGSVISADRAQLVPGATEPGGRLTAMLAASHHPGVLQPPTGAMGASATTSLIAVAIGLIGVAVALVTSGDRSEDPRSRVPRTVAPSAAPIHESSTEAAPAVAPSDRVDAGGAFAPGAAAATERPATSASTSRESHAQGVRKQDKEGKIRGEVSRPEGRNGETQGARVPEFTKDEAPMQIDVKE